MLDETLLQSPRFGPVERVLFLRHVRGFTTLPPADLAVLGEYARERVTRRGTALLRAGEPVSAVHLILEGRVRIRRRGRELGTAERGAVVGGELLLSRDPEGLEALTETDAVTLELDRESVVDALEDRFGIFRSVLREFSRELVQLLIENPAEAPRAAGSDSAATVLLEGSSSPRRPSPEEPRSPTEGEIDLADRILLVRNRTPFQVCSIDALANMAHRAEELRLPIGDALWRAGDRAHQLLFVVSGAIRCVPRDRGIPFRFGPGHGLGALEALAGMPRWYDAIVEEPVVALRIDVEHVLDVLEDNVDVGIEVLSYLGRTSVGIQEQIAAREGKLPQLFEREA
jgi:CRP-like cAMP-binding protein